MIEERKCKNCGASLPFGIVECVYCATLYRDSFRGVKCFDVPRNAARWYWSSDIIEEATVKGKYYCITGRLTYNWLMLASAVLIQRMYRLNDVARNLKMSLLIPAMLYPHTLTIFESELIDSYNTKNVLNKLFDSVWIDGFSPSCYGYNIPWIVFIDERSILADSGTIEDILYSSGTMP